MGLLVVVVGNAVVVEDVVVVKVGGGCIVVVGYKEAKMGIVVVEMVVMALYVWYTGAAEMMMGVVVAYGMDVAVEEEGDRQCQSSVGTEWEVTRFSVVQLAPP